MLLEPQQGISVAYSKNVLIEYELQLSSPVTIQFPVDNHRELLSRI